MNSRSKHSSCAAEKKLTEGSCMPGSAPTNFEFSNSLHEINLAPQPQSTWIEIWDRGHQLCVPS